jgi:glycosyltransferase involved in cell wall biosynthesis
VGALRARDRRRLRGGAALTDGRPVLLVTSHAPPDRRPAFAALDAREGLEPALFGGTMHHGAAGDDSAAAANVTQNGVYALAASGRYRAVICGTNGRIALPAAYLGARRARVPFVLWASLWAHPRSLAHAASYLPTRHLYAHADAVVAYGPHVAAYVRRLGARDVHVAPQSVDAAFWSAPAAAPRRRAPFQAVFAGRDHPEKGLDVLRAAWAQAGLRDAHLAVVTGQPAEEVRNFLAGSDVVVIPSRRTATFREPWGLVANEAMHQGLPVIATSEVGAAAGGLVRHERNGLVVEPEDPAALAAALTRLHADADLRSTLGAGAARDVASYTPESWAAGVSAALAQVGVSRRKA